MKHFRTRLSGSIHHSPARLRTITGSLHSEYSNIHEYFSEMLCTRSIWTYMNTSQKIIHKSALEVFKYIWIFLRKLSSDITMSSETSISNDCNRKIFNNNPTVYMLDLIRIVQVILSSSINICVELCTTILLENWQIYMSIL